MKAQALLLGCLGFCYAAAKNFPEGIACFQQALTCFRSLGEIRNELKTQLNLSTLFLETDALAEAHVHLGEALDLSETLEDHLFESVTLRKMGETYRRGDEISDAKRFLGYALEAARLQENQQEEESVLTTLGVVCLELGYTKNLSRETMRPWLPRARCLWRDNVSPALPALNWPAGLKRSQDHKTCLPTDARALDAWDFATPPAMPHIRRSRPSSGGQARFSSETTRRHPERVLISFIICQMFNVFKVLSTWLLA